MKLGLLSKIWNWIKSPGVMAAVALISIGIAVYSSFFYEKKPILNAAISNLSPVFDVVKPVGGLDISYDGVNLREAKKSLWSTEVTLRNDGNVGIKKDDFDSAAPVRLIVRGAQIVDRPSIMASNTYLANYVKVIVVGDYIEISPIIMEPGDSIAINFLILGADNARPDVQVQGKVAGIKSINLTNADSSSDGPSLWQKITGATSIWIQIARAPVYCVLFISLLVCFALTMALITVPFDALKNRKAKAERAEQIREIRRENVFDQRMNALADEYVENGFYPISEVAKRLAGAAKRAKLKGFVTQHGDEETANELKKIIGDDLSKEGIDVLSRLKLIRKEGGSDINIAELDESLEKFCVLVGKTRAELAKENAESRYPGYPGYP